MDQLLQRVLIAAGAAALLAAPATVHKFYPDDPLSKEPKPMPVGKLATVKLTDSGDFIQATFREPGEKQSKSNPKPSLDTNSLDELPDSSWYTNRHYFRPMTIEQLKRGADGLHPPAPDKPWMIYQAKIDGVTPGFRIQDSVGEKYVLKFDPMDYIEMATGADAVSARIFYALGYNVPDNYAVRFRREQVKLGENVKYSRHGHMVVMDETDLNELLAKVPRYSDGSYRGLASRLIAGEPLGPLQYFGTRPDDPNDIIPHERMRVLRGLYVFAAWTDHTDSRAINSLDAIQEVDGVRAVRHYLIDFGATLGSDSLTPKEAWHGHEYFVDLKRGVAAFATLGINAPAWAREHVRQPHAVGRFDADAFAPDTWKPSYPNPAFDNRTMQDCFWAAKQVAAFTDDQIRAIASTGNYTDPVAAGEIARVLIVRRDRIARFYVAHVLPLDKFETEGGELKFHDAGGSGRYSVAWSTFDNNSGASAAIASETSFHVPRASGYLKAEITDGSHKASVYVREGKVVGVER